MDALRIVLRAAFAFVTLLVLVRFSGKRTLKQVGSFDVVLVLVVGDLVDDAVFGDAAISTFVVAAVTLCAARLSAGALAGIRSLVPSP